jgi:F1F0 ATPase subunit 2
MNEALALALAVVAGLLLGTIFFCSLWWTVRKGMASSRPAVWFVGSFVLRTVVVLAGVYLVAGESWQRLLLCLLGFLVARLFVIRLTRQPSGLGTRAEVRHAP